MVIRTATTRRGGWLTAELIVSLGILAAVALPLAYSFSQEQKLLRAHYFQAVAMEIVDGELELLRAGQWRAWPEGEHTYAVIARAATNLPPGRFTLRRGAETLRLEWRPDKRGKGGLIVRETDLPR